MADGQKLTVDELAQKIRARYPGAYTSTSNGDLVKAWLAKYPVYKDSLQGGEGFVESLSKGIAGPPGVWETIKTAVRPTIDVARAIGGNQEAAKRVMTSTSGAPTPVDLPLALAGAPGPAARVAAPIKAVGQIGADVAREMVPSVLAAIPGVPGPTKESRERLQNVYDTTLGVPAIQKGVEQIKVGNIPGAAGSFTAALGNALMLTAPEIFGTAAEVEEKLPGLQALSKGGVELPSGHRIPVTPGTMRGGALATLENLSSESLAGGAMARKRLSANRAAQAAIRDITSERQGEAVPIGAVPTNVGEHAELMGRGMRHFASEEYYKPVYEAMGKSGVAQPDLREVAQFADGELRKVEISRLHEDISSGVRKSLERIRKATESPEMKIVGHGKVDISSLPQSVQDAIGAPAAPETPFESVEAERHFLSSQMERAGTNNDKRILAQLIEGIDRAEADAVLRVGGAELLEKLQAGRDLVRRGYALQDTGSKLRKAVQGTGITSAKGVKADPVRLNARELENSLEQLAARKPRLPGERPVPTTLESAVPNRADRDAIHEMSLLLSRGERGSAMSLGPKFGMLSALHAAGAVMAGGAAAALGAGHLGMGLSALTGLATGVGVFSNIMARPGGPRLMLEFLKAAPESAQATAALAKMQQLLPKEKQSQPPPNAGPVPPPQPTAKPLAPMPGVGIGGSPPPPQSSLTPAGEQYAKKYGISLSQ